LDQCGAGVAVGPERLGLPARAVEGEHQEHAQALAPGMLSDQRVQLGYGLGVAAEREVRFEPMLERNQAELFEPADLVAREVLVAELRQRRAAPEAERLAQHPSGLERVTVGERGACACEEDFEPRGVPGVRLEPKPATRL